MQFKARKRRQPPAVIIISLIDILIVLLIFLMVTTTFKQQPALKLALPESKQAEKGASDSRLVITVAKEEPYYYIGKRPVTYDKLQQELATAATQNPNTSLLVRTDKGALVEQFVKVLDAARASKLEVKIATKPTGQP
jgi:biopolymer transport protein ExbD